ncbi:MAG TPA: pitrilysin family protein [Terrimicrobiaceae bacterium]
MGTARFTNSRLTTLRGGLRIATCEVPHAEVSAIGIWAAVGGRHEPARLSGISHFIEHMLFKGTRRRSARRLMEEVEGIGGDMNAYTAEERTCYYAVAAAEFFPRLCDVLCDLYMNPKFSPSDIERERGVICEEILMYRDEPSAHVQEILNRYFWPDHPLGRPLTGTPETVESMQRDDFLSYRATHYHAGSTVVSAAGKLGHEEVIEAAAKLLEKIPSRRPIRYGKAPNPHPGPRVVCERRDVQQTQLALGLPGPSHHDPRRYAMQILHIILGGNASSRLFQELREKRGLCYSVSTHPSSFYDTGMLNISLGLEQRNVEKSLRVILSEFEDLRKHPVRSAELKRAKEYAVGASRMSLERTSAQNMRVGASVLVYGEIIDPEEVHSRLREVTDEDVQAAAMEFLDPQQATAAIVGPAPDEQAIEKILRA